MLAVVTEAASNDLQQYLAGVHHQRDTPVVAARCPIFLLVEHLGGCGFPLLRNVSPRPNADDDVEQSLSQGGITVEGDLEQIDGNSIRSNSLSFAKERMGSVNSCIVG